MILADIIFLIALYILVLFPKWKNQGKKSLVVNTLMYVYIGLLLRVTLMPILASLPQIFSHPYGPINLIPFDGVLENRAQIIIQVGLNIVLTIPFGFLFPLNSKTGKKNLFLKTILATFFLSLGIELLQPLLNRFRVGDITDIITNTCGGIVGYTLYIVISPVISKAMKYIE